MGSKKQEQPLEKKNRLLFRMNSGGIGGLRTEEWHGPAFILKGLICPGRVGEHRWERAEESEALAVAQGEMTWPGQEGVRRRGDKCLEVWSIHKAEPTGNPDGLDAGCQKLRGGRDVARACGLSSWKDGAIIS